MSTKKNTRKSKGKLADLEPRISSEGGVTGGAGIVSMDDFHFGSGVSLDAGAGKVSMQDFHFVVK